MPLLPKLSFTIDNICVVVFLLNYFVQSTLSKMPAVMTAPTIVYPQQATIVQQDGRPLEQTR